MVMNMLRICLFLSFLLISKAFILPRSPSLIKALTLPFRQGVTSPDEFYQAMTRFMTFVMPLTSVSMAFRTINMMAGLNTFMQTIRDRFNSELKNGEECCTMKFHIATINIHRELPIMESVFNNAMNRSQGLGASTMSSMLSSMMNIPRDRCLQRLVCEMAIGNWRRKKRDLTNTMQVKSPQSNAAEQRILISLKFSPNFPTFSLPSSSSASSSSASSSSATSSSASPSSSPTVSTTAASSSSTKNTCENLFRTCPYSAQDMFDALKKYVSVWRQVRIPKLWRPPVVEPLDLNRAFYVFG